MSKKRDVNDFDLGDMEELLNGDTEAISVVATAQEEPSLENIKNVEETIKKSSIIPDINKENLLNELVYWLHKRYEKAPEDFETADKEIDELVELQTRITPITYFSISKRLEVIEKFSQEEWFLSKYKTMNKYIEQKFNYARQTAQKYFKLYKIIGDVSDIVSTSRQFYAAKIDCFFPLFNNLEKMSLSEKKEIEEHMIKIATSDEISTKESRKIADQYKRKFSIVDTRKKANKKDPVETIIKHIYDLLSLNIELSSDQKKSIRAAIRAVDATLELELKVAE